MAKSKKKKPLPKTKPKPTKKAKVAAKPKVKQKAKVPAKQSSKPASPPKPVRHAPSIIEVGGRDAIHVELGAKLAAMRGDEVQERAAIASAIDAFMKLAIADGLPATASAYSAQCPEFFWEGSGANPPVYARVPDATHDEIGRWFQLIVEGVRAYDARVGATPS